MGPTSFVVHPRPYDNLSNLNFKVAKLTMLKAYNTDEFLARIDGIEYHYTGNNLLSV